MCGLAGIVGFVDEGVRRAALRAMAAAVQHRGPDDEGSFETLLSDGQWVGLAHRRLAIIDLAFGHQPMGNEDNSIQIVFNGEVYNFAQLRVELSSAGHVFKTHSDTETIVHAYEQWGVDCVTHLEGMFSFVIWDAPRQRLYMARDRFGEKPLFLHHRDGLLVFGSEIKSILAFPGMAAEFDPGSLLPYLAYRYSPGPGTMFKGISKLPPAHYAIYENGRLSQHRYYTSPDARPRGVVSMPPSDPVTGFLGLLDDAVRTRMVSDVPFGAFLSGGLDSSAIVALMSRHTGLPVKTFSVGFADARFSELSYARVVAGALGTEHHELQIDEADIVTHLPTLVRFRDAPLSEPSDVPIYLLSKWARQEVKMVLTGEGSDEVLGGYPKHVLERLSGAYAAVPGRLHADFLQPAVEALPFEFHRVKTAVASLGTKPFSLRMPRWFGALGVDEAADLLTDGPWKAGDPPASMPALDRAPGNSALREVLKFDQTSWLPDNLLERGDRMTMAASIEARMPFMDHRLLEFVSALPDHYRVSGSKTKWVLRRAMGDVLPDSILRRKKVGFRVPVSEWFRGALKGYVVEALCGPDSRTRKYFNAGKLDGLLDSHFRGQRNHEKLIWALLNLEVFHQAYGL
jgi:asparagine synthase (glutamine-hydrolysing)